MTPPPSSPSPPGSTGPPDRQTLRLLERHLADDPLVETTAFDPNPYEPRSLQVRLDDDQYPDPIEDARVDVQWFESGDFSFHYVEQRADDERWECRWDRYPNDHDPRLHFHRPPDAVDVEALSLSSLHPLEVSGIVLDAVEARIERLWESRPD